VRGGLILIGLAAAVDQLTQIANALRPRAGARPVVQAPPASEQPVSDAARPVPFPAQAPVQVPAPVKPPMSSPPRTPVFARPKLEERASEPVPAEPEPEGSFSAIERLRSSLGRPDRKTSDSSDSGDAPYAPPTSAPAAPAARAARGANGAAPAGGGDAAKKPALDFLFRSKAREPQPEAFESVWPQRGGRRRAEGPPDAEDARQGEAPVERPFPTETPAAAHEESRPPAILKSGVVDGMAYTLYADGSIEAQLPQGTVRFGSIAELRSHIENNS